MTTRALAATAARLETPLYTALRAVAGAMFMFHGAQKILGWLAAGPGPAAGTQLWFGGIIELAAGTLIALGLFTRAAAFLASGTMAVAYLQFHWKLALSGFAWLPAVNKGELAALYCFLFLYVTARGPGAISVDALRGGPRGH
ncbi:DoxX family protein [Anaeromyxobacter terrae]|uniref:DoxX family protein n=1 Tax=Anaeromyxobacter terrae TaxID=2925406 RepID=UPI001F56EBE5|nr:DoxX family protein [Anaeromyxobacter sp. SG22]